MAILDSISEFFKDIFFDMAVNSIKNSFDIINGAVATSGSLLSTSPQDWNSTMFDLVRGISESVILPIAGMIMAAVLIQDFISSIIDGNNFKDFDMGIIFKFIFKSCFGILILSNAFNLTAAVFDVGQNIVQSTVGIILDTAMPDWTTLIDALANMSLGELIMICIELSLIRITVLIVWVIIQVVIIGRMMEIFMYTSVSPIPFATFGSKEWSSVGQNYVKNLAALALQGFFMMLAIGLYTTLIKDVVFKSDVGITDNLLGALLYSIVLIFSLFKCGSISKSICNAI